MNQVKHLLMFAVMLTDSDLTVVLFEKQLLNSLSTAEKCNLILQLIKSNSTTVFQYLKKSHLILMFTQRLINYVNYTKK